MTVPTPDTDQVIAGLAIALPNWSAAVAENCWVAPLARLTVAGVTRRLVKVWLTVTLTLLVTDRPPASVMVTWKE